MIDEEPPAWAERIAMILGLGAAPFRGLLRYYVSREKERYEFTPFIR